MARGSFIKGPSKVSTNSRPSFVLGSRPPDLRAPRFASNPEANITQAPPRIKPIGPGGGPATRQYGKTSPIAGPGFGNTGLTSES